MASLGDIGGGSTHDAGVVFKINPKLRSTGDRPSRSGGPSASLWKVHSSGGSD